MSASKGRGDLFDFVRFAPLLAILAWTIAVTVYAIYHRGGTVGANPEAWGQFGDYVGGMLNPLIATVTLLALVHTIRLQRQLLDDGRKQHRLNLLLAKQQAFEQTFALMLERVNANLAAIEFEFQNDSPDVQSVHGQEALRRYIKDFGESTMTYAFTQRGHPYMPLRFNEIMPQWIEYLDRYEPKLGPYLRSIEGIYKYISKSAPTDSEVIALRRAMSGEPTSESVTIHEARHYANIVTEERSRYEKKLIALHAASPGHHSFQRLVLHYEVVKPLWKGDWWGHPVLEMMQISDEADEQQVESDD